MQPKTDKRFASFYVRQEHIPAGVTDERYETVAARLTDAGFAMCNRGALIEADTTVLAYMQALPPITLHDEYTFIRKYWGTAWALYVYLLRMISFKNWIQETKSFFSTRHVRKQSLYSFPVTYPGYENFDSDLLKQQPLVAVIIPTLNRYAYLKDVLHDLEKQLYKNFEVVVVDQSDEYDENFYKEFQLQFTIIRQQEKKLWTARNNAIKKTSAALLLFFDDDSRVAPDWITEHIRCLDFFKADISAGVSLAVIGQKVSDSYNYFRWATQFDSGNAMVRRTVFQQIGLFDEQFNGMRMGDGEFGYRAYSHGYRSISNYKASRVHLKVSEGGLREMGSWDGFRPTKWFAPKPVPSVLYLYKKYLNKAFYRHAVLLGITLSNVSYRQKGKRNMLAWSMMLTIIKAPVLYIQYLRSLTIAKKMLSNNYEPEILEK